MSRVEDSAFIGVIILDAGWHYTYINEYAAKILNRTPDELLGKVAWAEFPAAIRYACYDQFHKARKNKEEVHFEEYIKSSNQWVRVSAYPFGGSLHIALRKPDFAEISSLLESEYYLKYTENFQDLITLTSVDGKFRYLSPAILPLLGYEVEEMVGTRILTYCHSEDIEILRGIFNDENHSAIADQGMITCRFLHKKGWYVWFEKNFKWMVDDEGKRSQILGIWRDITERKLVEERFVQAQRLGQFGSFERYLNDEYCMWSEEMYRIHGLDPVDSMELSEAIKQIVSDDRDKVALAFETAIQVGISEVEYRIVRSDGEVRHLKSQIQRVIRDNGRTAIRGLIHDITSHKQIEIELKRSKANLEIAQEIAGLGHYDWDVIRNDLYWSDELFVLFRMRRESFGNTIEAFFNAVHPDDTVKVKEAIREALHGGLLDLEYRIIVNETEVRMIHTMAKTTYDEWGRPLRLFGTVQDITVQKQTEELLRKTEKLNVAGQLAAGIAHEIRNPLTALKGFAKLMCHANEESKLRYFQIMQEEFNRIELILGELLILAKPQAVAFHPHDTTAILSEVIELLNTEAIMSNVIIELDYEPNLPLVKCERNQLKQVFVNMIKNAIEAMPSGGCLNVSVRKVASGVALYFADQGLGISEERLPRIGEPFYTTKEKGTGLGVMVSFAIIDEHQGHIEYQSKLGVGTTVLIQLPAFS
jgi:two-component system sporulation sensor kinase A